MYQIVFYEDKNGYSEIAESIKSLRKKGESDKDAKINLNKIVAHLDLLQEMGTAIGAPVTKYLGDGIWELRPLKNRILYAHYKKDTYIILHHFIKKTRKAPAREIKKAKLKLQDYQKRMGDSLCQSHGSH